MPIPDEPSFLVRDAVAAGYSRSSLRSTRLEAPFHGVRSRLGLLTTIEQVCAAYAAKMPEGSAFTGLTAARLWKFPLPAYAGFDIRTLDVAARSPRRAPTGMHVRGSQYDAKVTRVVRLQGLPVLSAVDTWCSLARHLDAADLTAIADHIIAETPDRRVAFAAPDDLSRAVAARWGTRGMVPLKQALADARSPSWSRPESLLRLLLMSAHVPQPALNHEVTVGSRHFHIDLAWPDVRFGIEYDGDQHRGARQFADDIRRQELIQDTEWGLMRATRSDLFDRPRELAQRVIMRLASRGCDVPAADLRRLVIPRP